MEKEERRKLKCFYCGANIRHFTDVNRRYNFFLLYIEKSSIQAYECHIERTYFNEFDEDTDSMYDSFFCNKCVPKFNKIESIDIPKYLPKGQFKKWLKQLLKSEEVKQ